LRLTGETAPREFHSWRGQLTPRLESDFRLPERVANSINMKARHVVQAPGELTIGKQSVALKRRLEIADLVRQEGEIRVEELSQRLRVSAVTIRGDLNYLEQEGLLARRFGKAISKTQYLGDAQSAPVSFDRAALHPVLLAAAWRLRDETNIVIGHGALPTQLIPFLGATRDLKLTVASLDAATVARCCIDCETSIISGSIDSDGTTIVGSKALQYLRQTMLGVYIFEANAVTFQRGGSQGPCFSFSSHDRAHFFATACQHAMQSIALVRTTGFARDSGYITPTRSGIADLIFPAMPRDDFADRLRDNGYESRVFNDHVAVIFSRSPTKTE